MRVVFIDSLAFSGSASCSTRSGTDPRFVGTDWAQHKDLPVAPPPIVTASPHTVCRLVRTLL